MDNKRLNISSNKRTGTFLIRLLVFILIVFTIAAAKAGYYDSEEVENGYVPLYGEWEEELLTEKEFRNYEIDSVAVETYRSFLQDCISKGIDVYVFCSPVFVEYPYDDLSVTMGRDIASELGVSFFDLTNEAEFTSDSRLFWDIYHLNDRGARMYTDMVSNILSGEEGRNNSINIE